MLDNIIRPTPKGQVEHCWRCRQNALERPTRTYSGALIPIVDGYLWGAKRYGKEQLKKVTR